MTQRIKEFMTQAGTDVSGKWMNIYHAEKFAQLIAQECIDIIKPTSHHEVWAQSYLGGVDGLELLEVKVADIKKHFGVE